MSRVASLPNLLSLFRLVLLPFIIWLTHGETIPPLSAALGLFLAALLTDWADGYIARRLGRVSKIGAFLDQAIDKLLILSVLFVFVERALLPMWLVLLNLFRELFVSNFRQFAASRSRTVGANWMGKTKFLLQASIIVLGYACLIGAAGGKALPWGRPALFWSALAVTAASFTFAAFSFGPTATETFQADTGD